MPPEPERASPPHLSARKQLAFALFSVLLLLLLLEGAVRAYHALTAAGRTEGGLRAYVQDDALLGYAPRPGAQHLAIRINQLGFRGPEISRAKPAGVYRIVALGDSATFGPHEDECSYPYALQSLLDQHYGSGRFEVVNAAVEGYRSDHVLRRLQRDVLPLQPDLVLLFVGWNDLYQTDPTSAVEEATLEASLPARLLSYSDAAQSFRRLYFLHLRPRLGTPASQLREESRVYREFHPSGYEARLRDMVQAGRAAGARVALLTWPTVLDERMSEAALARVHYPWHTPSLERLRSLYARYHVSIALISEQEQAVLIDAAQVFDGLDKASLFKDTAHFSCQGHALLAEYLLQRLQDSRPALISGR